MAISAAVAKLSLSQIIILGTELIRAANSMYSKWTSKSKPPLIDMHAEVKAQIAAIALRLEALEENESGQVKLVKEMAEQLQYLSIEISRVSGRTTILLWMSSIAVVISCVALLVVAR